jgi:glycosyltransferase involved in cell wall biosynthesis
MEPSLAPDDVRRQFGWTDGRLVALHGGNLGLKQGLEQLIQTARLASHRGSRIRFVFAGGGNQEAAIREQARGLDNVDFLGIQPDGMYASLLRAADVLLLSERPSQLTMSLPSKLTSYLAAGRPIIAAVPEGGSTERAVRASGAALVVPAGDPEAILGALERLAVEGELAERLATAGARHAEERFQQGPSLERASAFVEAIAAGR